jgi:hypothetical protein
LFVSNIATLVIECTFFVKVIAVYMYLFV